MSIRETTVATVHARLQILRTYIPVGEYVELRITSHLRGPQASLITFNVIGTPRTDLYAIEFIPREGLVVNTGDLITLAGVATQNILAISKNYKTVWNSIRGDIPSPRRDLPITPAPPARELVFSNEYLGTFGATGSSEGMTHTVTQRPQKPALQRPRHEEGFFSLSNDPDFMQAIEIGFSVEEKQFNDKHPKMDIIFRHKETLDFKTVGCHHIALMSGTLEDANRFTSAPKEFMRTSEFNKEVSLDFEERVFALKSYVQGIAEAGLVAMFQTQYMWNEDWDEGIEPKNLPFGFNDAMQKQMLECIANLETNAIWQLAAEICVNILENVGESADGAMWIWNRRTLLHQSYAFWQVTASHFYLDALTDTQLDSWEQMLLLMVPEIVKDGIVSGKRKVYTGDDDRTLQFRGYYKGKDLSTQIAKALEAVIQYKHRRKLVEQIDAELEAECIRQLRDS